MDSPTECVRYAKVWQYWPDSQKIKINLPTGITLAQFPMAFLQNIGVNGWEYILHVLEKLVNEQFTATSSDGELITRDSPLTPGMNLMQLNICQTDSNSENQSAVGTFTMRKGPEMKSRYRPPEIDDSEGTMSDSDGFTINQKRFRESLIGRDFTCLVTDMPFEDCTAAHIVPQSRPDIYQRLLNDSSEVYMFLPSMGFLIRCDWHRSYDRLEWSFFYKDGSYIVHVFVANTADKRAQHGKVLDPSRFRGPERDRPDPVLTNWHYQQCVQARIRGFSA